MSHNHGVLNPASGPKSRKTGTALKRNGSHVDDDAVDDGVRSFIVRRIAPSFQVRDAKSPPR